MGVLKTINLNDETIEYLNTRKNDIIDRLNDSKDFGLKSATLVRVLDLDVTSQALSKYLDGLLSVTKIRRGNSETYRWILRKYKPLINMKMLKGLKS